LRIEKSPAKPGDVVLSVRELKLTGGAEAGKREKLVDVSFDVRAGEIVGIAGVEGNGQTELIEVIAGLRRQTSGKIELSGSEIGQLSARQITERGVAHIPEDRHRRGLLLDFDLSENTILGTHYRAPIAPSRLGLLDESAIAAKTTRVLNDFDVRPPDASLQARALSGGNQQKLIIGREFDLHPTLLLVSQPTRGVDIGAIEFIHRKLVELRDSGTAILLVSAELEEVLSLADRLLVMYQGQIVGEVDVQRADPEQIGLLMTGGQRTAASAI
jgi:simple sugar transport system ATP-binding protein